MEDSHKDDEQLRPITFFVQPEEIARTFGPQGADPVSGQKNAEELDEAKERSESRLRRSATKMRRRDGSN